MEGPIQSPLPQRPHHRRNASSKSNIFRSFVSPNKSRPDETDSTSSAIKRNTRTQTVPLLPPDHPHGAPKSKVLGERQNNAQSPPASPSKNRQKSIAVSKTSNDLRTTNNEVAKIGSSAPKKSKSSTNLAGIFAKMNRSSKDLSVQIPRERDKENTTPPSSSGGTYVSAETPIWAQYASSGKAKASSRPGTRDGENVSHINVKDEIAKYTPQDYSPSKQRNFNGDYNQPQLRPTLAKTRPQSAYFGADMMSAIGRRVSGGRGSLDLTGRTSDDLERRKSRDSGRRVSGARDVLEQQRKTSGSSADHAPLAKEKLTVAKRGAGERVMAAVAAFQSKTGGKDQQKQAVKEAVLDEKEVDRQFEAVLDSRNVPQPMRQKMRSLTLRIKADFIKQNQEASKTAGSPPSTSRGSEVKSLTMESRTSPTEAKKADDDAAKSAKRRSRTFTFSKADKRTNENGSSSPTKKQRSQSRSRPISTIQDPSPTATIAPRASMDRKRASVVPAVPSDYITYLKNNTDPAKLEVGRLHKLRILLRNETVSWVDSFLSLGGMTEITALLHRIMKIEWREEHEDQLLHEALLCLKGLCTTERAMGELEKVADGVFPALVRMLFDHEEKKGPAEYGTRSVVVTVLFNYLAAATAGTPSALEARARKILTYLGEPVKPETDRPVDFVLDMRVPRPYKLWCREVSNVTKEVFWIFLHHLNVIPSPPTTTGASSAADAGADRVKALETTYTHRHFPTTRPPVPAAPYIGGVEWDATTYITAHLDLMNGLIASLPSSSARNTLRSELRASGFEKVLGSTLRTCKEKFYSGVHDALRAWVAAAQEDGWETDYVREGPTLEEQARGYSPKKSPKKKVEAPPKLEAVPKLDLGLGESDSKNDGDDDGWLG
ncbi:hypothetical protein LTR37_011753 [Vermiconidia calcicola]|uniref:Uncharacterized protein n=1 Tax=Vermiconidia calcicola TaxID=1690605 RepID=A0ACC3N127_9PEZI|nr:hypothetical protein LTR37_011753 [Vermiconidia calcicola]